MLSEDHAKHNTIIGSSRTVAWLLIGGVLCVGCLAEGPHTQRARFEEAPDQGIPPKVQAAEDAQVPQDDVSLPEIASALSVKDELEYGLRDENGCELSSRTRHIWDAAARVAQSGHVPVESIATLRNATQQVLIDGEEIFPSIAEDIRSARHEIAIAMFVWEVDSDAHREIFRAIKSLEKTLKDSEVKAPVRVKLLIHANKILGPVNRAKPLVEATHALELNPELVQIRVATYDSLAMGVLHQKLVVVDGRAAHVTGANVEAVHDWSKSGSWHDTGYRFTGDVAHALLQTFDDAWQDSRVWNCEPFEEDLQCESNEVATSRPRAKLDSDEDSCLPTLVLSRRPRGQLWANDSNPATQGYIAALDSAEHVVKLLTPNLNDDSARLALQEAVQRGVRLEIVLSKGFNERNNELPRQGGGNESNVSAIYEWAHEELGEPTCNLVDIRWYSEHGNVAIYGNVEGASHAKYLSVDGEIAIVGSSNFDTQSWDHSGEVNVLVDSPAVVDDWDTTLFDRDFERAIPTQHCATPSALR